MRAPRARSSSAALVALAALGCEATLPGSPDRLSIDMQCTARAAHTMTIVRQVVQERGGRVLVQDDASGLIVFYVDPPHSPSPARDTAAVAKSDPPGLTYFNVLVSPAARGGGSVVFAVARLERGPAGAGQATAFLERVGQLAGGQP